MVVKSSFLVLGLFGSQQTNRSTSSDVPTEALTTLERCILRRRRAEKGSWSELEAGITGHGRAHLLSIVEDLLAALVRSPELLLLSHSLFG